MRFMFVDPVGRVLSDPVDHHPALDEWCVCRVCVMHAFYAFYTFHALIESVSYRNMERLKVQVPPPASIGSML